MLANIFRKSVLIPRLSTYAQKMKQAWDQDPKLVHEDWDKYFKHEPTSTQKNDASAMSFQDEMRGKELALSAYFLIRYYRTRGHESAQLDPLSNLWPIVQT